MENIAPEVTTVKKASYAFLSIYYCKYKHIVMILFVFIARCLVLLRIKVIKKEPFVKKGSLTKRQSFVSVESDHDGGDNEYRTEKEEHSLELDLPLRPCGPVDAGRADRGHHDRGGRDDEVRESVAELEGEHSHLACHACDVR